MQCGLLGHKLQHSFSPIIHGVLGDYAYSLFEKEENELEDFILNGNWTGLNVTIPYKKTVIPYLDILSDTAKSAGSVNTIVKRADGSMYGDNTDVYGFMELVKHSGINVAYKKALILGSGGASGAVYTALRDLGAIPVVISRSGENNYNNLNLHDDAEIIVNTTPLGMYPNNGEAAVDLKLFPACNGVFDLVYNPSKTALIIQAEELGIPYAGGLYMLVAQAKKSAEVFVDCKIPDGKIKMIYDALSFRRLNVSFIGMPGCGKTTIAKAFAKRINHPFFDSDEEIALRTGRTPADIISKDGESTFRDIESEVIADLGKVPGNVIATGGGVVLRAENYKALHQNGLIVWIKRNIDNLDTKDRPLSQSMGLDELYKEREPLYKKYSDIVIDNDSEPDEIARKLYLSLRQQ